MELATLDRSASGAASSASVLDDIVLARIAAAPGLGAKSDVARDLAPLAGHGLTPLEWRAILERAIDGLAAAGLVEASGAQIAATATGMKRASQFCGLPAGALPAWSVVKSRHLVAKALGFERPSGAQLKALEKIDGLASALVVRTFALTVKGAASPPKLRAALAVVALERAFGNQIKTGLSAKSGMSSKASRLLAAQLTRRQKDPGTDGRLVAVLAAEAAGLKTAEIKALQLAVLRPWISGTPPNPQKPKARKAAPRVATQRAEAPVASGPAPPPVAEAAAPALREIETPVEDLRPTFEGFVTGVHAATAARATGWAGNRKAYISHVWREFAARHPAWGLSVIEFRAMLTEAHRTGRVVLANADLKDPNAMKDVQESALTFKNAVFHFIRVDE